MVRILYSVIILGVLIFFSNSTLAETGQRFDVHGYSLHLSATKLGDMLVVTGTIKGGDDCSALGIYCYLSDEKNNTDRISTVLKNYRYSDKFSFKKQLKQDGGNRWKISDVQIYK